MMRKLGLSAGISNGFETVGFGLMSLFAASLGSLALDAYSISHNLVSTVFMIGLGLAVATGVRVGIETGRGQPAEAAFAGWTGFAAAAAVMAALAALVLAFRSEIAWVYTDDPVLIARVSALLLFSVLVFAPDAMQVVMGQAIRALGDAWVAALVYLLAFAVMLVPLGWWLTARAGFDERAIAVAITVCCAVASALLAWRFRVLTRDAGR